MPNCKLSKCIAHEEYVKALIGKRLLPHKCACCNHAWTSKYEPKKGGQ